MTRQQKINHHQVTCDALGCPQTISLAAFDIDHMRKMLHAHGWWMDVSGDIVRDEISGEDFIGYKTRCPAHREGR